MRRIFVAATAAVGAALATAGTASADGPFVSKPIDTSKYLVAPTTQATGFIAGATQTLSQAAGGAIESNGVVRTINNLFGKKPQPMPLQGNGIPLPGAYPSTQYQNSFVPRMPTSQPYRR